MAFDAARKAARARGRHHSAALDDARAAFCRALPAGASSPREFAACVAYGLHIRAITRSEADLLLAQAPRSNPGNAAAGPLPAAKPA
jgi:hypothetical protein